MWIYTSTPPYAFMVNELSTGTTLLYLTLYLLHFPAHYPLSNAPLPEGRASTLTGNLEILLSPSPTMQCHSLVSSPLSLSLSSYDLKGYVIPECIVQCRVCGSARARRVSEEEGVNTRDHNRRGDEWHAACALLAPRHQRALSRYNQPCAVVLSQTASIFRMIQFH
jgi:hypothetical protein